MQPKYKDEDRGKVDTYRIVIHCRNCGIKHELDIPKGVTKTAYRSNRKCDNCGCLIG
jgi:transcription elongation factor Elf1